MVGGSNGIQRGDYRKADKQRKLGTKSKLSDTAWVRYCSPYVSQPFLDAIFCIDTWECNGQKWMVGEAREKERLQKRQQGKETTEKPTKKETQAVRAVSATLGSLLFSLDFPTFPRHILLQRHIGMQYKRMNGRRNQGKERRDYRKASKE